MGGIQICKSMSEQDFKEIAEHIDDDTFLKAKMTFIDVENVKAYKWLCATALILARQHAEDPTGIEIDAGGFKMRITFEGIDHAQDDE